MVQEAFEVNVLGVHCNSQSPSPSKSISCMFHRKPYGCTGKVKEAIENLGGEKKEMFLLNRTQLKNFFKSINWDKYIQNHNKAHKNNFGNNFLKAF